VFFCELHIFNHLLFVLLLSDFLHRHLYISTTKQSECTVMHCTVLMPCCMGPSLFDKLRYSQGTRSQRKWHLWCFAPLPFPPLHHFLSSHSCWLFPVGFSVTWFVRTLSTYVNVWLLSIAQDYRWVTMIQQRHPYCSLLKAVVQLNAVH